VVQDFFLFLILLATRAFIPDHFYLFFVITKIDIIFFLTTDDALFFIVIPEFG